uniref:Leucyl-cystinyl aminopeptidase n=1 Tax=Magallana gigas TaxID=29159 RepID=K1R713_MAGGI
MTVIFLQKYVLKLMKKQMTRLGWKKEGDYLTRRLQSLLISVAVSYGDVNTVKEATDRFNQWMQNTDNIDPELQGRIFDAGIMYGSEKEWTFVKSQYLTVLVPSKRSQLMKALAKSRDDSLLSRFGDVSFTLTDIIKDSTSEFSTPFDLEEVQQFFKEHDAGPGTRAVQIASENIQMNIQWLEQNGQTVQHWLQRNSE